MREKKQCAGCPARAELIECRARLQAFEKALATGQLVRRAPGDFRGFPPAGAARGKEG